MRILIAPDKFKGCLSSADVASAIAAGVREALPAAIIDLCPIADGGEGTVDALVAATSGRLFTRTVTGPLPHMRVPATFGLLGDATTAVIEMAAASGLHLLNREQYNPLATTTYGTGELILAALHAGARKIILGIGGSATVEAGIGCLQALGFIPTLNADLAQDPQKPKAIAPRVSPLPTLTRPFTAAGLPYLQSVQPTTLLNQFRPFEILVACDVTNPLTGPTGAARIYGPQKGATPAQVDWLDNQLARFANLIPNGPAIATTPGAGAAGGLGFGLLAFLNAKLQSGFDLISRAVNLESRIAASDLILTGEGKLDASSLHGKTAIGVARLCQQHNKPCIALVGALEENILPTAHAQGLTSAHAICHHPADLATAIASAPKLLRELAAQFMRTDYRV